MRSAEKLQTELSEQWETLREKHWRCNAQKRFGTTYVEPALEALAQFAQEAESILSLCREAEAAAGAVRKPDEDDEY